MNTRLAVLQPRYPACGDCGACCDVVGVRELGKPYYTACSRLGASGCDAYDQRPATCRDFDCLWRLGFLGDKPHLRPDAFGFLFSFQVERGGRAFIECYETAAAPGEDTRRRLEFVLVKLRAALRGAAVKYYPHRAPVGVDYPLDPAYPQDTYDTGNLYTERHDNPGLLVHAGPARPPPHARAAGALAER